MTRPTIQIINVSTGEVDMREMNDAEYEQYLVDKAAFESQQAQEVTK